MIAPTAICRTVYFVQEKTDDRLSRMAGVDWPGCNRRHRGVVVSMNIICFIRHPDIGREPADLPTIAFRSTIGSDDPLMDHADTVPRENAPAENDASA